MASLTAKDIANVTFSKPPIGKRGYNEDEVDAFLDLLEADVTEYLDELDELRREVSNSPVAAQQPLPPAPPPPPVAEPPSAVASRLLELAERTADEVTTQARADADRVLREAREKASDITGEARYEASKMVDTARAEEAALRTRIEELRKFEENYRGRLETYMETQLQVLRDDARVEPAHDSA